MKHKICVGLLTVLLRVSAIPAFAQTTPPNKPQRNSGPPKERRQLSTKSLKRIARERTTCESFALTSVSI